MSAAPGHKPATPAQTPRARDRRPPEGRGAPPVPVQGRSILGVPLVPFFWIAGIVAVIPTWLLMQRHEIIETALPWIAGVIFAAVVGFTVFRLKGAERSRMLVAQVLIFFSVLFWALFEQAGSSSVARP